MKARLLLAPAAMLALAATLQAAEKFPAGRYGTGDSTVAFERQGGFTVAQNGETVVEGSYKASEHTLEITDQKGRFACTEVGPGKYNWKYEGGALTFEMLEDKCEGRSRVLTERPLKTKEQ